MVCSKFRAVARKNFRWKVHRHNPKIFNEWNIGLL